MSLRNMLFGRGGRTEQFEKYTPEQQSALSQILQQALTGLQGNQFDFGPIEEQARTDFREQTIPGIAERFTGMGAGGQRSSAFRSALGRAGSGLEQGLAAQKSGYNLQRQGLLQNLLGTGLSPRFESAYFNRQPGLLESSLPNVLPGLMRMFI